MQIFTLKLNYFGRRTITVVGFCIFLAGFCSIANAQEKKEEYQKEKKETEFSSSGEEWEELKEEREKEEQDEIKRQIAAGGIPYKLKDNLAPSNFIRKDWKRFHKMNNRQVNASQPQTSLWQAVDFKIDITGGSYGAQGVGVVRSIAIKPDNSNRVIAGSMNAGLWLTTDKGVTWQLVGKDVPLVETIYGIKFAPGNTNIVYAITNAGLIKSTDAGLTWNYTTNFLSSLPYTAVETMLEVSPTDNNKVFVSVKNNNSTNGGIYVTTNGGSSWTTLQSGKAYWDVKVNPANDAIVYAIEQTPSPNWWCKFVRSTDGGATFTTVNSGYPSTPIAGRQLYRAAIAVSPAAPDYVYVYSAGDDEYGFWRSTDVGLNFSKRDAGWAGNTDLSVTPAGTDYTFDGKLTAGYNQTGWDFAMTVSATNPDLVYAACNKTMYSANGGSTWSHVGNPDQNTWPIHGDIQGLAAIGNEVWVVSDGGVYYSGNGGVTAGQKHDGINANECWGFSTGFKSDIMAVGVNHNAIFIKDSSLYNQWLTGPGADAQTATVNPLDDRYIYAMPWWDTRFTRTTARNTAPESIGNLGVYSGYVNFQNYVIHPNLYNKVYVVGHANASRPELVKGVAVSDNNAISWSAVKEFTDISSGGGRMQISFADPNTMLAIIKRNSLAQQLWKTNDGGTGWTDITPNSTLTTGFTIKNIALSDKDVNRAWLVLGAAGAVKVLQTTDGGTSWTDYSTGLPLSTGTFGIVYQRGTNDGIYVGTRMGVYYRNATMSSWQLHGTGMLAGEVNFLQINYDQGKIRAATTRGIWENGLYEQGAPMAEFAVDRNTIFCGVDANVQFKDYSALPRTGASWSWSFPGATPATSTAENPVVSYSGAPSGKYSVTLTVTDGNGNTSTKPLTDFIEVKSSNCTTFETVPGNAINLAGPNDNVNVRLNANTNTISIAGWVKPNGAPSDWSGLFTHPSATGLIITSGGQLGCLWNDAEWDWQTGVVLPASKWSHVALVIDATQTTIYLNGVPVSQAAAHTAIDFSNSDFYIGSDRGRSDRNFNGEMDEVVMYNRAITQDEIRSLMHLTHSQNETGLLGYYQFNEPENNIVFNKVTGSQANISGGATKIASTAPVAGGTSFKMNINAAGNYNFTGTGAKLEFGSGTYPNGEVAMYKLNSRPNSILYNGSILVDNYWIMENWGANSGFNGLSTVTISDINVPADVAANPASYKLYTRASNEHLNNWDTNACPGTSASAGSNGSMVFNNGCSINSERQFAIMQGSLLPVADFSASLTSIVCSAGTPVEFTAVAVGGSEPATSWSWSFPGGTPSTSTLQNPKVLYKDAPIGQYDVTLTVTNANGSNTKTIANYINKVSNSTECDYDTVAGSSLDLTTSAANYVAIPAGAVKATTNQITMMAWVKPNGLQTAYTGIMMFDNATGMMFGPNGDNELRAMWGGNGWNLGSGLILPDNQWSHVAFVVDGNNLEVYLNGNKKLLAAQASPAYNFTDLVCKLGQDRSQANRNLNGYLEETSIYTRALSQDEIREKMHLTKILGEIDLKVYLQFNETAVNTIYNKVDKTMMTNTGGTKVVSTAPVASGVSQTIQINAAGTYNFAQVGMQMQFGNNGLYPNGNIVISRLNSSPDTAPVTGTVNNNQYYVVHNYGTTDNFTALKKITLSTPANPLFNYYMYKRACNAFGNTWGTAAANGSSGSQGIDFTLSNSLKTQGQLVFTTTSNTPAMVAITSPVQDVSLLEGSSVTINADASDPDGSVAKVAFYQADTKLGEDLTTPYSFTWNTVSAGTYDITAVAADNSGATTSSAVLKIKLNVPPAVSISLPGNTTSFFNGSNVTINTNTSDADGTIKKVEFYAGDVKIGESTSAPFSYTWTANTSGSYALTAKAIDNDDFSSSSESLNIVVLDCSNFEPNNNRNQSVLIPVNTFVASQIADSEDKDWFKFVLTEPSDVMLTLTNLPKDYNMYLYNSNGSPVASSENRDTANESIIFYNATGTYYVQIRGYKDVYAPGKCYVLKVNASAINKARAASSKQLPAEATDNLDKTAIKVYPVPVRDVLNILFNGEENSNSTTVTIVDLTGKIVYKEDLSVMPGVNHAVIRLPGNVSNGLYFLKLGQNQATKIVVMKN
jgi:PKD repeat protein